MSALAAAGILLALGLWLGVAPILTALRSVSAGAVVAALAITAGTTWACALRWSLLADRLGVTISLPVAYRAYYRAQFLNAALPSGVVGEVDRAVWHGRTSQAMARGIRSVVWDRVTGQVALFGLAILTIPVLAPALRGWLLAALAVVIVVLVLVRSSNVAVIRSAWAEARRVPGAAGIRGPVFGLSALAAVGHVAVFVIAARAVGVGADVLALVPLGLVVLLVSAIPLGIAGWGPREGGAALVFAATGLGADTGLAVSVTYGVLSTCATLPGILVLYRRRGNTPSSDSEGGSSWATAPTRS